MAVLVTGATGFVGGWLVRALLEKGEDVHVLHRRQSNLDEIKDLKFTSKIGDITDPESLEAACRGMHTVFHLAGLVAYSRALRPAMQQVNVEGTRNVVEAVKKSGSKLLYMSSVVAVGASFDGKPLNEDSPYTLTRLNLGYFETKKAAEDIVIAAARAKQIDAVIVNPSTIYGAADAKKGSRGTQIKVAKGKFPFYTSGGASIVSVHDVVSATLKARELGRSGERYILCGENLTIKDLFARIAKIAGVKPPGIYLPDGIVHSLGKTGDLLERVGAKGPVNSETAWTSTLFHWFDHSKATRQLGFNPRPAQQALEESVGWMKTHGII